MGKAAVFLDRDGTLNVEKEYLHRWEDWEWIPGAIDAIRRLNEAGFLVIVTTNQSGIARGYYTEADVLALHQRVDEDLTRHGARIDAYYYCPHHPQYGENRDCVCRKPEPGMLLQAAREHDIDLSRSYMIGDKAADVEAALAVDAIPILVLTGYGVEEQKNVPPATVIVQDVGRAVEWILQ